MSEYRVVVKITNEKWLKYHVHSFLKFTNWLDKNFPEWKFYNVYDPKTGYQIANFTKNNRPKRNKIKSSS